MVGLTFGISRMEVFQGIARLMVVNDVLKGGDLRKGIMTQDEIGIATGEEMSGKRITRGTESGTGIEIINLLVVIASVEIVETNEGIVTRELNYGSLPQRGDHLFCAHKAKAVVISYPLSSPQHWHPCRMRSGKNKRYLNACQVRQTEL